MSRSWSFLIIVSAAFGLSGCQIFRTARNISQLPPTTTIAETHTSYSYIPLDPLPVTILLGNNCTVFTGYVNGDPQWADGTPIAILESLPDQAVRIAVGQYDASGTLVYGPAKIGLSGQSYQVVLDYVSVDTRNVPVYIHRTSSEGKDVSIFDDYAPGQTFRVARDPESDVFTSGIKKEAPKPLGEQLTIPVYVGVGLRLTASVTVTNATANLSSLGTIAADAEAGKLTGSLIVQTLGVTGKAVSITLPLPSELNRTTIQNAILALGSIKAVLYDSNTVIAPRVVGIYNPVGGGQQVVNGIISVLASDPLTWARPCTPPSKTSITASATTPSTTPATTPSTAPASTPGKTPPTTPSTASAATLSTPSATTPNKTPATTTSTSKVTTPSTGSAKARKGTKKSDGTPASTTKSPAKATSP
jgi:hypothetical protein